MIPGEYFCDGPLLELNAGRSCSTLEVNNTGDRPIQVGSHFHFFEANRALKFDRPAAYGMRLDIPAGTAVRFEPGEIKSIQLIPLGGLRQVYGGSGLVMGSLDVPNVRQQSLERLDDFLKGNYLPSALLSKRKADKASKPNKPAKKSKR